LEILQEIRILDLLDRREEEFRRIADLESQVQALLYPDVPPEARAVLPGYPFPAPPVPLPSEGRTSRTKCWRPESGRPVASRGGRKSASRRDAAGELLPVAQPPLVPIRPLQAGVENAYRVTYRENGQQRLSLHASPQALEAMIEMSSENFMIERIETVLLDTLDDCRPVALLWEQSTEQPC